MVIIIAHFCPADPGMQQLMMFAGKMNSEPGRLMMMDKIEWQDGWPVVGVPSDRPRPGPQIRRASRLPPARSLLFSRTVRRPRLRPTTFRRGRFYPGRSRTRKVR